MQHFQNSHLQYFYSRNQIVLKSEFYWSYDFNYQDQMSSIQEQLAVWQGEMCFK